MRAIYRTKGRAAEYSPLAINLYTGCDHGCRYCYGPRVLRMPFEQYMKPVPRRGLRAQIEADLRRVDPSEQILLSFIGDPYCRLEAARGYTREALEVLWFAANPVAVLTKGGRRCLRDGGLFASFGRRIKVGATLTLLDEAMSRAWEPGAALPEERIETLEVLHDMGVRTWVSMEPVLDVGQSLALLERIPFVDEIRLGKLNHNPGRESEVAWGVYLRRALEIAGPRAVVKHDLLDAAVLDRGGVAGGSDGAGATAEVG